MKNNYLENKINLLLHEKVDSFLQKDLLEPKYVLLKKENTQLAFYFDGAINNFYNQKLKLEITNQKLPKNLQKEMYLFTWVSENGYQAFINNYLKVRDFLFEVHSNFYPKLNLYYYRFHNFKNKQANIFMEMLLVWENIIVENVLNYHFEKIEKERKKFSEQLFNRVEIFQQTNSLLNTVWNFFGLLWDPNDLYDLNLDFKIIDKFANFISNNSNILELAKILGRFKGVSNLLEQRIVEKIVIEYQLEKVGTLPEEVIGVTASDNLEHVIPSEFVFLSDPKLKYIFYKKFLEKKLTSLEFLSLDYTPVSKTNYEIKEEKIPEYEGPIILCIDSSKSMQGTPEQIAKAITLAIIKIAASNKRSCYIINFSSTLKVYNFTNIKGSLPELINFLSGSFNSSTNLEPAVEHAINIMEHNEYFNADLLVISDLIAGELSSSTKKQILNLQSRRNRFNALSIGTMLNKKTVSFFNNVWVYDPRDPLASEKIIGSITEAYDKNYQKYYVSNDIKNKNNF